MKKTILILVLLVGFLGHSQIGTDKYKHFAMGALISGATYAWVYQINHNKKQAFIWSLVTPVVIGTVKELIDSSPGGTGFDPYDLGATVLGGLTVNLTIEIFKRKKK